MGYDSLRTELTWYLLNTRDFPSPSFLFPALFLEALPQCKSLLLSPSVAVSYSVMSSLWVIFEPRLSDIEQDSKISLKKNFFFLFFSFSLTCSIIDPKCLAWRVPWTEEPGGLQSLGSRRVGDDWATSLSPFTFMHWRRKWQPTHVLASRIPGMAEPGRLPSMGLHRVGQDWSDLAAAAAAVLFI